MDVTSLLNSSSAALQQQQQQKRRDSVASSTPSATAGTTAASTAVHTPSPDRTPSRRTSGSRSPNRNRTPWDAGGYSLPLSLDTKSIRTPSTARPVFYCESQSPTDGQSSPKSPKHKFSDSRSSLSSYASSNNSVSHSRISSLSTVSEFQPLTNLITEFTQNSRIPVEKWDNGMSRRNISSPARSPPSSVYSIAAEEYSSGPVYRQRTFSGPYAEDISPTQPAPPVRPGSPSDAVIIRRGQEPTKSPSYLHNRQSNSSNSLSPDSSISRAHKRAVSAPNFPASSHIRGTSSGTMPRRARGGPVIEIPHVLDRILPPEASRTNPIYARPRTTAGAQIGNAQTSAGGPQNGYTLPCSAAGPQDGDHPEYDRVWDIIYNRRPVVCELEEDCDLVSPMRKCISHIFGRNKKCTRMMPNELVPHICRKHYQRTRYRNAISYAMFQCGLIHNQLCRIQSWSDKNAREGSGPVLKFWKISPRLREEQRDAADKDKDEGKGRKRRRSDDDEDEEDSSDESRNAQGPEDARALPPWMKAEVGKEKSSLEMIAAIERLKGGLRSGAITQMVDFEIIAHFREDEENAPKAKKTSKPKDQGPAKKRRTDDGPSRTTAQFQIGQAPAPAGLYQFGQNPAPVGPYQFGQTPAPAGPYQFDQTRPGLAPPAYTAQGTRLPQTAASFTLSGGRLSGPLPAPNSSAHAGSLNNTGSANNTGPVNHTGSANHFGPATQGYSPNAARLPHQRSVSAVDSFSNGVVQPSGAQNQWDVSSHRRVVQLPPLPQQNLGNASHSYGQLPFRIPQQNPNSGSGQYHSAMAGSNDHQVNHTANILRPYDGPFANYMDVDTDVFPPNEDNSGAFGGGAKHTRHQSTSAIPPTAPEQGVAFFRQRPMPEIGQLSLNSQATTRFRMPTVSRAAGNANSGSSDLGIIGGPLGYPPSR